MISEWSSATAEHAARALLLVACALTFLEAAATIHVVYTLQPSYVVAALALLVGLPFAVEGFRLMPRSVRWSLVALVAVYVAATFAGHQLALPHRPRTGSLRSFAYLGDLVFGVLCLALARRLFDTPRRQRAAALAFVAGGAAAAVYALYQWFAQRYGLPLTDLNNTLDSNGITAGSSQGQGILGWTRARGTFLEPHFLGEYCASIIPLAAGAAVVFRGWLRRGAGLATVILLLALLVTSSAPDAGILAFGIVIATALAQIGLGHVRSAAVWGALAVAVVVLSPVALVSPVPLAAATGRSSSDIAATIHFRTHTWSRVMTIWSRHLLIGYGPGQSAVQLAAETDVPAAERPPPTPLQSAQGIWAASLVDAGILGVVAWIWFVLGALVACAQRLRAQPAAIAWPTFAAAVAALAGAQMTGDRLELRTWLLVALALAVAGPAREIGGAEPTRDDQSST